MLRRTPVLATMTVLGVLGLPQAASATGPRCADLPAPIYVAGAASAGPLLRTLSQALLGDKDPAVVVYQARGSCAGVEAVVRDTDPGHCQQGACITGSALFYTTDGSAKSCDLDATGTHAHLALSDVFAGSCPALGGGVPPGTLDVPGPVSPLGLVAPQKGPEPAIHMEEAHFVFGFGQAGGVLPWTSGDSIIIRDERSSGQVLLGLHLQVPPGRFKGVRATDAADVISRLLAGDSTRGIGFLPTSLADPRRGDLKVLAFQARGQRGAFFPDRTAASLDKQNVRDGHYPLWGYLHVIAQADPAKPDRALRPEAQRLMDLVLGNTTLGALDPLQVQLMAGLVPQCAMKVARGSDTGPMVPYVPPAPCSCWFEKAVPKGSTSCTACTDDKACGTGKCRRNLCEVH